MTTHLEAVVGELARGGEPGHAGADDGDALAGLGETGHVGGSPEPRSRAPSSVPGASVDVGLAGEDEPVADGLASGSRSSAVEPTRGS